MGMIIIGVGGIGIQDIVHDLGFLKEDIGTRMKIFQMNVDMMMVWEFLNLVLVTEAVGIHLGNMASFQLFTERFLVIMIMTMIYTLAIVVDLHINEA